MSVTGVADCGLLFMKHEVEFWGRTVNNQVSVINYKIQILSNRINMIPAPTKVLLDNNMEI